jgi:hypothetical protein
MSSTITVPGGTIEVRKRIAQVERVYSDGGRAAAFVTTRVVVAAVLKNPYAGRYSEDLSLLIDAGEMLAEEFMTEAMRYTGGVVAAYGKGGVVGELGELEHVAAVLHPKFGGPTRGLSDGVSILPSMKKHGGQGAVFDIPVHHKTAMKVRSHFDSIEFRVPDAPFSDEILVALAITDGPRPHARVGGLALEDAIGIDGVN